MKVTLTHKGNTAEISSKTGNLRKQPISIKTDSNRQAIKTGLFMIFTQFVKSDKRIIIEIKPGE